MSTLKIYLCEDYSVLLLFCTAVRFVWCIASLPVFAGLSTTYTSSASDASPPFFFFGGGLSSLDKSTV